MNNEEHHGEHANKGKENHSMPSVSPKRDEGKKENSKLPDDNHQTEKKNNKPVDKEQKNEHARNAPGHDPEHSKDKSKKQ